MDAFRWGPTALGTLGGRLGQAAFGGNCPCASARDAERGQGAGRHASRQRSPVRPVAGCMAAQLAVVRRKGSATENIVTEASLKRRSMNEGYNDGNRFAMGLNRKRLLTALYFPNRIIQRNFPLRTFIAPNVGNSFMGAHSFSSANALYLHVFATPPNRRFDRRRWSSN